MLDGVAARVDGWAGQRIEGRIRTRHRRRLERAGHLDQLEPPDDGELWSAGGPPPREGCGLDVLIDGEEALSAIAAALAGARSSIHIAGWCISADFGLTRDRDAARLRDLLGELAERVDVRVLLWAGAPLRLFSPNRSLVRRTREELIRGTRVQCGLDARERPMHCHHEKLVLIDGEIAFVGGIDLTYLGGDRFDSSEHPMRCRLGWHDAATRISGPAVADVAEHFACRWREVQGEALQAPLPLETAGGHTIQVVRTVPEKIYDFRPNGDFRILEAYTRALRSARRLVYLESQFMWSSQAVDILAAKLRRPPSPEFRVVVLLPMRPNNGGDATLGQLGVLADADGGAGRFLAATLSARTGALTGPLYVHAKVGIVDDAWLTIGSANLNEHSFFNDTEMNVVVCEPALVRDTRLRLWSEHLELPAADVAGEPHRVVDELWRPIAVEQRLRQERGEPATNRLQELRGLSRRSMTLVGPLQGLFVDG